MSTCRAQISLLFLMFMLTWSRRSLMFSEIDIDFLQAIRLSGYILELVESMYCNLLFIIRLSTLQKEFKRVMGLPCFTVLVLVFFFMIMVFLSQKREFLLVLFVSFLKALLINVGTFLYMFLMRAEGMLSGPGAEEDFSRFIASSI